MCEGFEKQQLEASNCIVVGTAVVRIPDDNMDDCEFFKEALEGYPVCTYLTSVNEGKQLMDLLITIEQLPDVIFLDINMNVRQKLAVQKVEKEKLAAELITANKELLFQDKERGKRAAELGIANKELVFEDAEKGKRAVELGIVNIELDFQKDEKEKRAEELS